MDRETPQLDTLSPPVGLEEITDPLLFDAKDFLVRQLAVFDQDLAQTITSYNKLLGLSETQDVIHVPDGEPFFDDDVAVHSASLGRLTTTLKEYKPGASGSAPVIRKGFQTGLIAACEAKNRLLTAPERETTLKPHQKVAIEKTSRALDYAIELAQSDPEELALDIDQVRDFLAPAKRVNAIMPQVQANDRDAVEEYCQLIEDLPSAATLGFLAARSYASVINFLAVEQPSKKPVGIYAPEERQRMIEDGSYTEESLRLFEAAQMLSMAYSPLDVSGGDPEGLGIYNGILGNMMGLNRRQTAMHIAVGFGKIKSLSNASSTPEYARPAMAAIETVREVAELLESNGFRVFMEQAALVQKDGPAHLRRTSHNLPEFFEGSTKGFYSHIHNIPQDEMTSGTAGQLLLLEGIMVRELSQRLANREAFSPLPKSIKEAVESHIVPHVGLFFDSLFEADKLAEIESFCEISKAQIEQIDQPYHYTSNKIRGFEGGVSTLRDISAELDKRQMLPEDEIRQTLAIILLQAENAEDKDLYFMQLKQDRHAIEELLGGLSYMGQDGSSRLTDALRWVDEVIDAGLDTKFEHYRLKKFLENYYLGGEDEPLEAEAVAEPVIEALVEIEPVEEESLAEESIPEKEAPAEQENNPNLIDEYFAELKDVLENVEVEFSDVQAFPPDGGSRREIKHHLDRATGERFIDIDRNRLRGMVELKAEFERMGKSARLIFTSPTKWSKLPYFALYVQEQKDDPVGVCMLENVVNGLATYSFGVDGKEINSWEDMIGIASLKSARDDFGATASVHPNKGAENFAQHYSVVLKNFAMLELAKVNKH